MKDKKKIGATLLVLGGGRGERMGGNKFFLSVDGEPVVPNEPADDEPVVPNEPNDPNVPDEEIITGDGGSSIGCDARVSGLFGVVLLCGALALKRPKKRG